MDESVFIYIARMMRRGYVPYRDMFDHKGPYLFFFELIGDLCGDTGIWILELIFAFAASIPSLSSISYADSGSTGFAYLLYERDDIMVLFRSSSETDPNLLFGGSTLIFSQTEGTPSS